MTNLLEIREILKNFYSKYDRYLFILLRFLVAFICMSNISNNLGSGGRLDSGAVIAVLSVLSGVLGSNFTVILCGIYMVGELMSIALDLAIATAALFVIFLCLYFAVAPEDGMVLLLSALCASIGLPFFMPVAAGLTRKASSALPVAFGVLVHYLMKIMGSATLKTTAESSEVSTLNVTMNQLLGNKEFFMVFIISMACVFVVYVIRRMTMDYAWLAAILFGMLLQLLLTIVGNFMLSLHMSLLSVFVGFIFAAVLNLLLTFFAFNMDYNRVENVQFEDDEYYYYVKAVPKVTMARKNKQEKVIHAAKRSLAAEEEDEDEE